MLQDMEQPQEEVKDVPSAQTQKQTVAFSVSEQERKADFQSHMALARLFDQLPGANRDVTETRSPEEQRTPSSRESARDTVSKEVPETNKASGLGIYSLQPVSLASPEYKNQTATKPAAFGQRDSQGQNRSPRYSRNLTPKKTSRHTNLRRPVFTEREPSFSKNYGAFLTETKADFQPLFVGNPRLTFSQQQRSWTAPSCGTSSGLPQRPKSEGTQQWRLCKQRLNTEIKVFPFWGELRRSHTIIRSALPSLSVIEKEGYVIDFEERRKRNPTTVPYKEFYSTIKHYFKEIPVK